MPRRDYILNEIDIVYRPVRNLYKRPTITCPDDAHRIFRENWDSTKIGLIEEVKVMLLNHSNRVLGIAPVSRGGMSGTVSDSKIIFGIALKTGATGIILAHNHPSGNLDPSGADLDLDTRIRTGGSYLSIRLLDNLILSGTNKAYTSIHNLSPI